MTEITFHTEETAGAQLFFVSESRKKSHTGVMQTHACNEHTHLPFRQNMAFHLYLHLSTRNKCRFLSWFSTF